MRRFEREARATAALKSPHTVQLYDFGATEDGRLYYVMELLDGLDLETLVRQYGPLPAERVVHILRQVCSSLQDAHVNGLVHRDIKPANVVVSRAGTTFDFAKVLDFGLVKLDTARRAEDDASKLSTEGSTSGTPAFMAPEVVLGDADTDHRVDLYALGCVGYWLLTGKLVFEGASPMEVMFHHAHTAAAQAVDPGRAAHPGSARGPDHGVPGEGPGAPSGQRGGREHPARRGPPGNRPGPSSERSAGGRRTGPYRRTRARWRMCSCRRRAGSCGSGQG